MQHRVVVPEPIASRAAEAIRAMLEITA
jgi:hypothetical protein